MKTGAAGLEVEVMMDFWWDISEKEDMEEGSERVVVERRLMVEEGVVVMMLSLGMLVLVGMVVREGEVDLEVNAEVWWSR